jgi:hypothetical protein
MTEEDVADADLRIERWHLRDSGELPDDPPTPRVAAVVPPRAAPAPSTTRTDAVKVMGSWLLRVARQPISVTDAVADDANEFKVQLDYAVDGRLGGTIRLPDGSDSPLDEAFAEGAQLSFSFRTRAIAGVLDEDGSISGSMKTLDGQDYAFIMSRVVD